jgi:uncharacterized membrane protein
MTNNLMYFIKKNFLPILIIIFALCGFVAAFTLSVEKLDILKHPNQVLSCDINPFVSCGTVMRSKFAEVFGIPWSFAGIAGYPAVILLGLIYIERQKLSRWLSIISTAGIFFAFSLSTYFMYVSAYIIGAFCPWCVLSAISSTTIFFMILVLNIRHDNYELPDTWRIPLQNAVAKKLHVILIFLWFVGLIFFESLPFWIYR